MKKLLLFIISTFLLIISVFSNTIIASSSNYYENVDTTLYGEELLNNLSIVINQNVKKVTYKQAYTHLEVVDRDPDVEGNVKCVYSGYSMPFADHYGTGVTLGWAREHVWPKSHGFPEEKDSYAYCDLHNLHAVEQKINSTRGNSDFDELKGLPGVVDYRDKKTENSYSEPGNYAYDGRFEPRDEIKGDIARTIFYMSTMYNDPSTLKLIIVDEVKTEATNVSSHVGYLGKLSVLLKWHKQDPVSEEELRRNEEVYKIQNNRNPFVDNPQYVDRIWNYNETYTVEFNTLSSSSIPSQFVTIGGKVEVPSNPVKDGYTFEGWYTDYAMKQKYDFTTPVESNLKLYAHWIDNSISVFEQMKASINFSYQNSFSKVTSSTDINESLTYYLTSTINDYMYYGDSASTSGISICNSLSSAKIVKFVKQSNGYLITIGDKYIGNNNSTNLLISETIPTDTTNYIWNIEDTQTGIKISMGTRMLLHRYSINDNYNIIKAYASSNEGKTTYYNIDIYSRGIDPNSFNNFSIRFGGFINKTNYQNIENINSLYILVTTSEKMINAGYEYFKEATNEQITSSVVKKIIIDPNYIDEYSTESNCLVGIVEDIPWDNLSTSLSAVCVIETTEGTYYSQQVSYSFTYLVDYYYNHLNDNSLEFTSTQQELVEILHGKICA